MALVTVLALALGAAAATWWLVDGHPPRLATLTVACAAALLGAVGWLRDHVRRWQREFGSAVEYVARRKRESEAGIRFEAP